MSTKRSFATKKEDRDEITLEPKEKDLLKSKHIPNWKKRREKTMREFLLQDITESRSDVLSKETKSKTVELEHVSVTAYCTAEAYDINSLYLHLSKTNSENISIISPENNYSTIYREYNGRNVFYFEAGSVVCWGLEDEDISKLLSELKAFEINPVTHPQTENMEYRSLPSRAELRGDKIVLSSQAEKKEILKQQLAFSYGLHQSVKVEVLEERVAKQIRESKDIQNHLVKHSNWLYMSDRRLKQRVNMLLSNLLTIRGHINLYSELEGTPNMFWDHPELQVIHSQIYKNLEISDRISISNKRLDYSQSMLDLVKEDLNVMHSTRLEMLIIYLIAIEVVEGLLPYVSSFISNF